MPILLIAMRIPTHRHEVENTSMTPMIDVIFQLLIEIRVSMAVRLRQVCLRGGV